MEQSKILTADVLDIIFEGRNKAYGAYELRKTYKRRLIISVCVMLGICLFIFLAIILANFVAPKKQAQILVQDVQLANVQEEKKPPPPPPPPPKQEPPKVEIKKFTPPKIVKDEEVKPEEKPPEQEKIEDTKIGTINKEGIKTDVAAPPVEQSSGQVEAPKVQAEDYDKEFKTVQREAKFP